MAVFYLSIVAILWETYTLILIGWLYSNLPPDWSILLQFVAVFYLSIVAILVGTNSRKEEDEDNEEEEEENRCQVLYSRTPGLQELCREIFDSFFA